MGNSKLLPRKTTVKSGKIRETENPDWECWTGIRVSFQPTRYLMKRLSALLFTVVLAAPFVVAPSTPDDTVVEEIIARVNNSIVTRADLRHAREQLLGELRQSDPNTADQQAKD